MTRFLAKEELPWSQWWVGSHRDLAEDWNIDHLPFVFVIDAKGVIQNKGVTGNKLEAAVASLLKKVEKKKK